MVRLLLLRRLLSYSQAVPPFRLFVISYRNVPSIRSLSFSTSSRLGLLFYSRDSVCFLPFLRFLKTFFLHFAAILSTKRREDRAPFPLIDSRNCRESAVRKLETAKKNRNISLETSPPNELLSFLFLYSQSHLEWIFRFFNSTWYMFWQFYWEKLLEENAVRKPRNDAAYSLKNE